MGELSSAAIQPLIHIIVVVSMELEMIFLLYSETLKNRDTQSH